VHSAGPRYAADVMAGYRSELGELTAAELDRLTGILWLRPLWLAAWRCWLAVVSAKASRAYLPDRERIGAIAAAARACPTA
jgi:Ser/Thr protein kinase RdoA (MazF antagonist)